jgi:PAS domain S-box-containing protein
VDITERKQAEVALRESEERFRIAAQAGRMYAYEWDVASDVVVRSRECVDLLGVGEPTRTTRRELMTRVYPDDRCQCDVIGLTPQNPITQVRYRMARSDGSLMWAEKTARAFFDEEGRMLRMVGMVADVTERKQAEEKLRASEERYRRIVETTNEGIWLLDPKFHTSFVNRQMARMLGYEPEEMLGRSVFDFYFAEDVDRKRQVLALRREGLAEHFDERLRRRDGTELWVRMAANAIYNDTGEFEGAMAIVCDITEQRLAQEALRESEERFRLVANSAPVMIWMSGTNKKSSYFNQTWLDFTGRSEAELQSGLAEITHPDDLEKCREIYRRAFDQRQPFRKECRLRRHDGRYRRILDIGVPRYHADGSFAGYIGSCVDVTERMEAEEALSSVNRRLIEAHEEERTWIARELHDDINQKVALLAVELDELAQNPPESTAEACSRIRGTRERVSDLEADIQALSHRLHSSKLEHLGIAAAAAGFCRELATQQRVEIDFDCAGVPRNLPSEVSLCLFRVLQEALHNAVKYSGARRFRVELGAAENEIRLVVSDSGLGFDPEAAMSGSGLGLISMRERVHLVGGEISIESQPNRGTNVRVRVPARAVPHFVKAAG